jgi:hypothetical protein
MVYFANFQHFLLMSDLLSCTTKLDEPRVLYVCRSTSRELRGLIEWSIQRIPSSLMVAHVFHMCASACEVIRRVICSIQDEHVIDCNVAIFIIRVHSACRICEARIHSIQMEGVRGWMLSMQRLDAWIRFLYWMVMYVDASVACWHERLIFCRYTNNVS